MSDVAEPGGHWIQVGMPSGQFRNDWIPDQQPASPTGLPGEWHVVIDPFGGPSQWEWFPSPAVRPQSGGAPTAKWNAAPQKRAPLPPLPPLPASTASPKGRAPSNQRDPLPPLPPRPESTAPAKGNAANPPPSQRAPLPPRPASTAKSGAWNSLWMAGQVPGLATRVMGFFRDLPVRNRVVIVAIAVLLTAAIGH